MTKHINENKQVGSIIVHKFSVAGMTRSLVVYEAYERSSYSGPHSTLMSLEGFGVCGTVYSRRLPKEIEAMKPGTKERCDACDANRKANESEAYAAIVAAYPEAADGNRTMGQIEVYGQ